MRKAVDELRSQSYYQVADTSQATPEQALYRLLRLFMQKSERAHAAAPPFQIEPAALGFDLVLGATMIAAASIVVRCCKMRWQIPARGLSTPFYVNVKINHSLCPSDYVLFLTVEKLQKAVAVPPSLCYTLNRSATLSQF